MQVTAGGDSPGKKMVKTCGPNVPGRNMEGNTMKVFSIAIAVLVLVAIGGYLVAENADTSGTELVQALPQQTAIQQETGKALPSVADMLEKLEKRLEREPDDASGWDLLGRSYEFLGRHEDAKVAFARSAGLGYQQKETSMPGLVRVRGRVNLDPDLKAKVSGGETVFIFARAVTGPRMPLAVLRKKVSDLPVVFEMNDSMAMTPEYKLSDFGQVIVGARISMHGGASAGAGDLEGFSAVVDESNADDVVITIDQAVLMQADVTNGEG